MALKDDSPSEQMNQLIEELKIHKKKINSFSFFCDEAKKLLKYNSNSEEALLEHILKFIQKNKEQSLMQKIHSSKD
jgi:hypothetical protein